MRTHGGVPHQQCSSTQGVLIIMSRSTCSPADANAHVSALKLCTADMPWLCWPMTDTLWAAAAEDVQFRPAIEV